MKQQSRPRRERLCLPGPARACRYFEDFNPSLIRRRWACCLAIYRRYPQVLFFKCRTDTCISCNMRLIYLQERAAVFLDFTEVLKISV